ncbi:fad-dependent oxygenase [Colletotrichum incanum]|uniref:Fad-dependent oxygenase n=1 Tax=Colletotrichum incanum TaxID=1573173 RepID=A0A161WMX6_COLIC|nr:fad-dependent oxygenase [Colletotrichum incanum]
MEFVAAGLAWALNQTVSSQTILSRLGLISLVAQSTISWPEFSAKLSPQLSPGASVILQHEPAFTNHTSRWRDWHSPDVGAVVRVFTENDVQATIQVANAHGLPFLARSGGHGATESLSLAKNVVVIDLRGWNAVDIAEDGVSATIGGGASVKKVVNSLWEAGKQTVTGICECVGISAPVLGGGHGWLQGQYGLASDQIVSARLVLANGEAVTASPDENPGLFWALRGAGHNFGIVTEWQYRVYDIKNSKWFYEIFIFLGDQLEEVFELTNKMMKTQPPEATYWIYFVNIPEIDSEHPIIWYAVIYDGPVDKAMNFTGPLHDIQHVSIEKGLAPMPDLASLTFMGSESIGCAKGFTGLRFPIGLKSHDLPAVRRVFDDIAGISNRVPELSGSFFLLEGYSTQGVKAIDEKASAFPHRDDNILVTPYIMYRPNASIDAIAQEHGKRLRNHLLMASGDPKRLRAYVNYAHGDEPLEAMYGWDDWRLGLLKSIKAKWDPENRMRFYNPLG